MEEKSIMSKPEINSAAEWRGFLTHKQVAEAKTYCKLEGPTTWQKKQVVKLYLKLITGVTFAGNFEENDGLDGFYQNAKQHFLS